MQQKRGKMDKRIGVVTGAGRGIGRKIAVELAKEGCYIVINCNEHEEEAFDTLKEVRSYSDGMVVCGDVSDEKMVAYLMKEVQEKCGHVNILVNNAGKIIRPGKWDVISQEVWDRTIEINAKSVFYMITQFVPLFEGDKIGHIINIASTVGENGGAGVIAYSAAKAAVVNMTKAFSKVLAPRITVNAIAPGNIDTDMTTGAGEVWVKKVIDETPMKRLGKPEEVAYLAAFLASDKAEFLTGQIIDIDGGYALGK